MLKLAHSDHHKFNSVALIWAVLTWEEMMVVHASDSGAPSVKQAPDPDEAMAAASTGPAEKQPLLPAAAGAAAAGAAGGAAAAAGLSAASGQPAAGSAQPPAGTSQRSLQSQQVPIHSPSFSITPLHLYQPSLSSSAPSITSKHSQRSLII